MPLVRGCRNRHCPEYAGLDGWCDRHRKAPFYGAAPMPPGWAQIRDRQLRQFPLCAGCLQPATDVHHVVPRSAGGTDAASNLVSLCGECHHRITGRMHGAW